MAETMRAIVKKATGPGAELRKVPVPKPGPREVLVKVLATSICGTDVSIYDWQGWTIKRIHPPHIMGHEFAGDVAEVGKEVETVKVGDRVSAETHVVCCKCAQCKTGNMHVCEKTSILGVDRDGSFAEYVVIPEFNAWHTSEKIPLEVASVQEPLGNSVHAAMAFNLSTKNVVIFGQGPIGLFTTAIAKHVGARKVITLDLSDYRLGLSKKMGADVTIKADGLEEVLGRIKRETGGKGADVAMDMSGAKNATIGTIKCAKQGGEVILFGLGEAGVPLDVANDIVFKGLTIKGIIGRLMFDTWFKSRGLLEGGLNIRPAITHILKFEEFEKGIELMKSGKSGKVVLIP